MLVLLLDGSEKFDRRHIAAVGDADMVIGADGEVIKAKGDGPARVNVTELRRVLATNARPRKTAPGDGEQPA